MISGSVFIPSPFEATEKRLQVEKVVLHPQYSVSPQYDSDIALIFVNNPSTTFCEQGKVEYEIEFVFPWIGDYVLGLASLLSLSWW